MGAVTMLALLLAGKLNWRTMSSEGALSPVYPDTTCAHTQLHSENISV